MQMRLLYYANFSCRDVNAKFIYDDANAPLRSCECKSLFFDIKMPLTSMSWCKRPSVGVSRWKCPIGVCHDANVFYLTQMQFNQKILLFSKSWLPRSPGIKMFSKLDLFFSKIIFFILTRLECPVHHSCPKNMFYFDLRLLKIGDHF